MANVLGIGKAARYIPAWLDRILPDLDIEGDLIIRELENRDINIENVEGKVKKTAK